MSYMKKLVLSVVAGSTLLMGISSAVAQIVVKEEPVVITKQGDYYVVPEGTLPTTEYYTYTDTNTNYVCSYTEPAELTSVQSLPLAVQIGTNTSNVYCYPNTYFTVVPIQ